MEETPIFLKRRILMTFVKVDEIPGRKSKHYLQDAIKEFAESGHQIVKVEFDERDYKNANSAYSSMLKAVKTSGYHIALIRRKNNLYLMKEI